MSDDPPTKPDSPAAKSSAEFAIDFARVRFEGELRARRARGEPLEFAEEFLRALDEAEAKRKARR